jgi:general secretion pathway protein D
MLSYRRLAIVISCSGLLSAGLAGCSTGPTAPSSAHLREADAAQPRTAIPAPVAASVNIPKPRATAKTETYSVVVNNVKVQELLFALARDAKLNVDIHPGIQGTVTLNAIDQTLQQLLTRIAKQVDMRWELEGPNLAVMPDSPFLRTYKVDYVNMTRDASSIISANSQITSGSSSGGSGGGGMSGSGGTSGSSGSAMTGTGSNVSITRVENKIKNRFWESLEQNIKDLLRETDKLLPEGSSETVVERSGEQTTSGTGAYAAASRNTRSGTAQSGISASPSPATLQQDETTVTRRVTFREAASVIVNAETGIVTVRATGRQHEKIQEFLDHVTSSARRQVMIEATIVEVELNNYYQQGINWNVVNSNGRSYNLNTTSGISPIDRPTAFSLSTTSATGITTTLSLLEQFGNVKVLSSPKLSVLNNQAAVLKVVENLVYFTVKSDTVLSNSINSQPIITYTSTPYSVSVGLIMSVTPQISENNSITLNVRPSITNISGYANDPTPNLAFTNQIPTIRTRELESIMRVEDGEIAVLGGLMQETSDYTTSRVPGLGALPIIGEVFTSRDNVSRKSELVIFLRPIVIRDPSMAGDYRRMRGSLPAQNALAMPEHAKPLGGIFSEGTPPQ